MNKTKLSQIEKILHGKLINGDAEFQQINTDSRKIKAGELFVALQGPNFNAHDFIADVKAKGAVGAIVSQMINVDFPQLQVADTLKALGQLASWNCQQFNIPFIALTGSCGKTTVKETIHTILAECGPTLANQGTLNNDIGVPLTLLNLSSEHRYAVIEMGANHPGEIAYLTEMVKPTIAFINNIAPAHLEGFGSIEGVAKAKFEIFNGLAKDGTAIVNVDDHYADWICERLKGRKVLSFGIQNPADISAHSLKADAAERYSFMLVTPAGEITVNLGLLGKHNVLNALAAAAATYAIGIPLTAIKSGLEKVQAVPGRLVVRQGLAGARIFDDTYNANPFSVRAALEVLAKYDGERIAVLGDMGELGADAEQMHTEIGRLAKELGINHLYACGKLSRATVQGFGEGAEHFEDKIQLSQTVRAILRPTMTVLVKGSRSAKMEQIVAELIG